MLIRPETPEDFDEIDVLVEAAFGQPDEAALVRRLRASDYYVPELTLVAEDETLVGHVMLSYVDLEGSSRRILSLAPLSVRPDRQNQGIGTALTHAVLDAADDRRAPIAVVLGHPTYYPRFGFESARALGIDPQDPALPNEVWMAKRLAAYDPSLRGRVVYPPAFD
jgi:putative acetyltransferase